MTKPTQLQLIQAIAFAECQLQHNPGKLYSTYVLTRLQSLGYAYDSYDEFYDAVRETGRLVLGPDAYSYLV